LKLGSENRKQVIVLAVLGIVALGLVLRAVWPSGPAPAAAPAPTTSATNRPSFRRTSSGKLVKATEPRLDPTLALDLLKQSEQSKYAGKGRNIFANGQIEIPEVKRPKEVADTTPPPPPPPPPINLKFFGFASKPGEPKRVFLSQGEDVFIAGEGDIVDRRYRVLHISPGAVDIEDVMNNNRQSIPLTQG